MSLNLVWVIDTSSLLAIDEECSAAEARAAYALMTRLVEEGRLVWPPQVEEELSRGNPDEPTRWAQENQTGKQAPTFDLVQDVMAKAGNVVDKHKAEEDADAYVLALALRVVGDGRRICVVTNDYRDGRGRLSMASACEKHLGLPTMRLKSFLQLSGL